VASGLCDEKRQRDKYRRRVRGESNRPLVLHVCCLPVGRRQAIRCAGGGVRFWGQES